MPSRHARLSPSASKRWLNCPGSIQLSDHCQKPESTKYADEGTKAHSVAERKLRVSNGEYLKKELPAAPVIDAEMNEATDFYATYVTEAQTAVNGTLMVEQEFSLADYFAGCFGTADAVVIGDDVIEVIDLKYGKGIRVDAKENPQLMLYGLGTVSLLEGLYDFTKVKLTIIQPRLDHVSSWEISVDDLKSWGEEVAPIAKKAYDGCEEYCAGDWCHYCPAAAQCKARANYHLELEALNYKEPALLTDEEIGDVLTRGEKLTEWSKAVRDYVTAEALNGKKFPGRKLVEGRSVRRITDEAAMADRLRAAGIEDKDIFKVELNGITALEKNVGKKRLAEIGGELIDKPAGKPTLVVESDKRKELNLVEKAKEDFKDE